MNAFRYVGFTLLTLLLSASCAKSYLNLNVPECIEKRIKTMDDEAISSPPREVWEWELNGSVYYYITSDCCDQYNYLYDDACSSVCAPDGGFTGKGDGSCPQKMENAIKTIIWKQE